MATNKQIAEVFREAKKVLWKGSGTQPTGINRKYICLAISDSHGRWDVRRDARWVIRQRLGGVHDFRAWLEAQPGVKHKDMTTQRVQAHRHAWLDMLIAEFESK